MRRRKLRVALVTVTPCSRFRPSPRSPWRRRYVHADGEADHRPGAHVPASLRARRSPALTSPRAWSRRPSPARRRRRRPRPPPHRRPPRHPRHPRPLPQPRRVRPRRRPRRAATPSPRRVRPVIRTSSRAARTVSIRAAATRATARTRRPRRRRRARARARTARRGRGARTAQQGHPDLVEPVVLVRAAWRRPDRRPELLHRQLPDPAVPAPHLPGRRHPVRRAVADPRRHQRDRDGLRP